MSNPVVYFVAVDGRIKIGHTVDIEQRLAALRTASAKPLQLLATVKAPRRTEAALHSYLSRHRIAGEWFHDCAEVRDVMRRVAAGHEEFVYRAPHTRRRPDANVVWASDALKKIAGPRALNESTKDVIARAASGVGMSYWRAFDLWYQKARMLKIEERTAIAAALRVAA